MEEVTKCPVCSSTNSSVFNRKEIHGFFLINRICNFCGLVYLSPRMDQKDLENFYRRGYRGLNDGSEFPTEYNTKDQIKRTAHIVEVFRLMALEINRFLDIGCSTGILMEGIREAYGCIVAGIEPTDSHRNIALENGLQVYPSIETLIKDENNTFDLIALSHVLEHLPDPVKSLNEIRLKLLTNQGHLFIEVPNLYGHDCFEPGHLFSFTKKTLFDILRSAGFEPVYDKLHGLPRSLWRLRYIIVIAKPLPSGVNSFTPSKFLGGALRARFLRRIGLRDTRFLGEFLINTWKRYLKKGRI